MGVLIAGRVVNCQHGKARKEAASYAAFPEGLELATMPGEYFHAGMHKVGVSEMHQHLII